VYESGGSLLMMVLLLLVLSGYRCLVGVLRCLDAGELHAALGIDVGITVLVVRSSSNEPCLLLSTPHGDRHSGSTRSF